MKAAAAAIDNAIAQRFLLAIQRGNVLKTMEHNWDGVAKLGWYLGPRPAALPPAKIEAEKEQQ